MVKRVKREGWRRGGYGVLLQASTRREPATSTARVSSTRVSKQTLHASPLEHLRGGETAIEALTVLSTRALAMEGAWGVTAGCSDAPSPGARLPSIPGTWRQGGEVSGGGESPKRRGGECAISTQNPPCRGNHSSISRTVEAPSAPVLEQTEGEEADPGTAKNRRRRSSGELTSPQ